MCLPECAWRLVCVDAFSSVRAGCVPEVRAVLREQRAPEETCLEENCFEQPRRNQPRSGCVTVQTRLHFPAGSAAQHGGPVRTLDSNGQCGSCDPFTSSAQGCPQRCRMRRRVTILGCHSISSCHPFAREAHFGSQALRSRNRKHAAVTNWLVPRPMAREPCARRSMPEHAAPGA